MFVLKLSGKQKISKNYMYIVFIFKNGRGINVLKDKCSVILAKRLIVYKQ